MNLHPFRLINPGVGGRKLVRFDSRDLALTAVFAALYVIVNLAESFFAGSPFLTYGPVQLRVADSLIALSRI